jgi:energy-coupling factor transport system permease protein
MWPVVAIGLALSLLIVPFNVLTGSAGASELFEIPEWHSPSWFGGVTLGGAITGEALVMATGRALTISTLVVAAAGFNASVDHFRLVRLAPRSLANVMLVLTVAVLVVPQAVEQGQRVIEVRRLRGRGGLGVRALPAILLPVLAGALERSVQRAESLEARGFGAGFSEGDWRLLLVGIAGVGVAAWGAFALFYYGGYWPIALIVAGVVLVITSTLRVGGESTERLRSDTWSVRDALVAFTAGLSLVLVLMMRGFGAGDLTYVAYPDLTAPGFHVAVALAFALFLIPAMTWEGLSE